MQEIALSVAATMLLFDPDEDRDQIRGLETLDGKALMAL
jgi:hypothetical protein